MRAHGNRLKVQQSQLLDHCPSSSFIVLLTNTRNLPNKHFLRFGWNRLAIRHIKT